MNIIFGDFEQLLGDFEQLLVDFYNFRRFRKFLGDLDRFWASSVGYLKKLNNRKQSHNSLATLTDLAVDVAVRSHAHGQGVDGPRASLASEAPLVVHVVLHRQLLGLEDGTAAPGTDVMIF
jgi:hypothetical protein